MCRPWCLNGADTTNRSHNAIINHFWPENLVTLSRQCYPVPSSEFKRQQGSGSKIGKEQEIVKWTVAGEFFLTETVGV